MYLCRKVRVFFKIGFLYENQFQKSVERKRFESPCTTLLARMSLSRLTTSTFSEVPWEKTRLLGFFQINISSMLVVEQSLSMENAYINSNLKLEERQKAVARRGALRNCILSDSLKLTWNKGERKTIVFTMPYKISSFPQNRPAYFSLHQQMLSCE